MKMYVLRMTWLDTKSDLSGEFSEEILSKDIEGYVMSLRILFDTKSEQTKIDIDKKYNFTAFMHQFIVSVTVAQSDFDDLSCPTNNDPEQMVHYWDMLHAWKNKI